MIHGLNSPSTTTARNIPISGPSIGANISTEPPLSAAMNRIRAVIDDQTSAISALQSRLGSVCRPAVPQPAGGSPETGSAMYSPAVEGAFSLAMSVEFNTMLIRDLLERLEA